MISNKAMTNVSLTFRIACSLKALGICWLVSGLLFGSFFRDTRGFFLFFFWSVPFFVAGWILVGIPILAMGNRILKMPKIFLGIAGAVAGAFLILFPFFVVSVISRGTVDFTGWRWSSLKSGPAFGAGIGASGVILYRWLLSR